MDEARYKVAGMSIAWSTAGFAELQAPGQRLERRLLNDGFRVPPLQLRIEKQAIAAHSLHMLRPRDRNHCVPGSDRHVGHIRLQTAASPYSFSSDSECAFALLCL